jgi:cobalamin biosynthesis protein CobD/CbiB
MTRWYLTVAALIAREQRRNRMAQRLAGMAACALLLLTATMIAGWIVTW